MPPFPFGEDGFMRRKETFPLRLLTGSLLIFLMIFLFNRLVYCMKFFSGIHGGVNFWSTVKYLPEYIQWPPGMLLCTLNLLALLSVIIAFLYCVFQKKN